MVFAAHFILWVSPRKPGLPIVYIVLKSASWSVRVKVKRWGEVIEDV